MERKENVKYNHGKFLYSRLIRSGGWANMAGRSNLNARHSLESIPDLISYSSPLRAHLVNRSDVLAY